VLTSSLQLTSPCSRRHQSCPDGVHRIRAPLARAGARDDGGRHDQDRHRSIGAACSLLDRATTATLRRTRRSHVTPRSRRRRLAAGRPVPEDQQPSRSQHVHDEPTWSRSNDGELATRCSCWWPTCCTRQISEDHYGHIKC